jgi:hypothetical protein
MEYIACVRKDTEVKERWKHHIYPLCCDAEHTTLKCLAYTKRTNISSGILVRIALFALDIFKSLNIWTVCYSVYKKDVIPYRFLKSCKISVVDSIFNIEFTPKFLVF